jgi:hypothetical protein
MSSSTSAAAEAVPLLALLFEALPGFTARPALAVLPAFPAFAALPVLTVCALLAELAVLRLDRALDVAGAVGTTAGAPAEPLSDAVLRRAGRAGPEDVTMGFLREARVYGEMNCCYFNCASTTHELRNLQYCESNGKHRHRQMGEVGPSVLLRGAPHCIIPHDAV